MTAKKKYQLTTEGKKELEKELEERTTTIRRKLQDELDSEISDGDITENTSYYRVQEEIASNEKRVEELEDILKNAEVIEDIPDEKDVKKAQIGTSVTLKVRENEVTYHLVGSTEADPSENKITIDSPLGTALNGKRIGETAKVKTPVGIQEYDIVSIE
jgi:transcription elongation factor GreA